MGDPKKLRRKYGKPKHPWEGPRIKAENDLVKEYGLKNKKEIWRAEEKMKKYRRLARELVGDRSEKRKLKEEALILNLTKKGFLKQGSSLDEILSMNVRDIFERRLQTLVWKKGFALTIDQARQFITHGHISLNDSKVRSPGMFVDIEKEKTINWVGKPIETLKPGTTVSKENMEKALKSEVETVSVQKDAEAEAEEVEEKVEAE